MFIPNDKKGNYKKGDVVLLLDDLEISYGKFTQGHTFIIDDKNGYGYIMTDTEHNITVKKIHSNQISRVISCDKAKQLQINRVNKWKYNEFCTKNCPHKGTGFDHYDKYDYCKIKKGYQPLCRPDSKCVDYIDHDKIVKNEFMTRYLRGLKIKKCLKKET